MTRLVAVDGLDGSGKTRFAAALADACVVDGLSAAVVHVDDFRRRVDFPDQNADAEASVYYEHYFDLVTLERDLASLQTGPAGIAVVIVEGVFTLRIPAVAAAAALVMLQVSPDEARRRIFERDRGKGRSDDEINRRIERRYFPARDRYRAELDPDARADAIIDNEDWLGPRLIRRKPGRFPAPIERLLDAMAR